MQNRPPAPCQIGDRIELIAMGGDDPCQIPSGTRGTVVSIGYFDKRHQITVDWDISRSLSLVYPPDSFRILPKKHEYTMDISLFATVTVTAKDETEARQIIKDAIDGADSNFGAWPDGNPITSTVVLDGDADLLEIDGEAV